MSAADQVRLAFLDGFGQGSVQMEARFQGRKVLLGHDAWEQRKHLHLTRAERGLVVAPDIERLREALRRVKRELTVPAAEYVPAIPAAWDIIDEALSK